MVTPYLPVDRMVRRSAVGSIINLANQSQGATWTLVDVAEHTDKTVMVFDMRFPMADIAGTRAGRVVVTLEALPPVEYDAPAVPRSDPHGGIAGAD